MFLTTSGLFPTMIPVGDIARLTWCGLEYEAWDVTFRDGTVERHNISAGEIERIR